MGHGRTDRPKLSVRRFYELEEAEVEGRGGRLKKGGGANGNVRWAARTVQQVVLSYTRAELSPASWLLKRERRRKGSGNS
jgi:hypothetical protein